MQIPELFVVFAQRTNDEGVWTDRETLVYMDLYLAEASADAMRDAGLDVTVLRVSSKRSAQFVVEELDGEDN